MILLVSLLLLSNHALAESLSACAKDDAAGQAIANRMSSQITGLNQASRNANDGISIAQTAEGALNQINDNVQRIRELSVQAENGTNSQSDLGSIQDEINQRLEEIDRISQETDFNGTKVLDEGVTPMSIQVGANDGETIEIAFEAINAGTLEIGDFSVRGVELLDGDVDSAFLEGQSEASVAADLSGGSIQENASGDLTVSLNGSSFDFDLIDGATTGTDHNQIDTSGGEVTLESLVQNPVDDESARPEGMTALDSSNLVTSSDGTVYYEDDGDFYEVEFEQVTATAGEDAGLTFSLVGGADAEAIDLTQEGLTTDPEAVIPKTENPLSQLDDALSKIDGLRSELGAVQNRFEDAITNLDTNSTNLSAARSRIEDADYAMEVADMTRSQILQQAGTSVLAQANQIPQNVLSLLG